MLDISQGINGREKMIGNEGGKGAEQDGIWCVDKCKRPLLTVFSFFLFHVKCGLLAELPFVFLCRGSWSVRSTITETKPKTQDGDRALK